MNIKTLESIHRSLIQKEVVAKAEYEKAKEACTKSAKSGESRDETGRRKAAVKERWKAHRSAAAALQDFEGHDW